MNKTDGRTKMIGCNIRPGHKPGGFLHDYTDGRPHKARGRPKRAVINHVIVKEHATAFLEGRGFLNMPTSFDSTARTHVPQAAGGA